MQEKGLSLSYSIEPDIIANGDPEKVKQVITILLDNALKYTNENGQIAVMVCKVKQQALVSIKNTGKGIAKEHLPKIFDRFYRVDPARSNENGSYGLGLAIAKMIIDRLGGEICVTSEENQYTTFTFSVPLHSPRKDYAKGPATREAGLAKLR